jgi:hypothetical protein
MTIIDVETWSKAVAKEYLTTGKPMNESIEKLASDQGLNKDQVSRVVEAANTEVYVQMFNQTPDKYVQYAPADTEKIAEKLFGTEKVSEVSDSDYQEPPTNIPELDITTPLTKIAEVEPDNVTNTEALHEYYKLAALDTRLAQSLDEVEMHYQQDAAILYSMIKQAVLSGTSFGNLERALTSLYEDQVVKINVAEAQEKLAQEIFPRKLDMSVSNVGTVNTENPLVKQAGLLLKHAADFKNLKAKRAEIREKAKTHTKEGTVANVLKGVAAGTVIGAVGTNAVVKKRAEQAATKTKMQQLSTNYAR